jgi:hypothetical protein
MKNIINVFGIHSSPFIVSSSLRNLNVSHTVFSGETKLIKSVVNLSKEQPAWPIILPSIKTINRYKDSGEKQILFVCDALAALSHCNVKIIKIDDITNRIKDALIYSIENPLNDSAWKLIEKEPSVLDYVTHATKPSFLNGLQSAIYKITPYALRKEIQELIIGYLGGTETRSKLSDKLNSNYKLDALKELIKNDKFANLRNAVTAYKKTNDVEETAKLFECETFEILYLARSSANTSEDKKKAASNKR